MDLIHGDKRMSATNARRVKKRKTMSRNSRRSSKNMKDKFGIVVPNFAKEALSLDETNGTMLFRRK